MLAIKVKHVNYGPDEEAWTITSPRQNSKGGKTHGRAEIVYVGTARLKRELQARRFLGDDGHVFGTEADKRVASFNWEDLFEAARDDPGRQEDERRGRDRPYMARPPS